MIKDCPNEFLVMGHISNIKDVWTSVSTPEDLDVWVNKYFGHLTCLITHWTSSYESMFRISCIPISLQFGYTENLNNQ
jgi:hypothetical protein